MSVLPKRAEQDPQARCCLVSGRLPEVRSKRTKARRTPASAQGVERKGRLARRVKRFASVAGGVNFCKIRPIKVPLVFPRTGIAPIPAIRRSQANPQHYFGLGVGVASCWVQSTSIGLWGCTGGRLPLGYHIRRYERRRARLVMLVSFRPLRTARRSLQL